MYAPNNSNGGVWVIIRIGIIALCKLRTGVQIAVYDPNGSIDGIWVIKWGTHIGLCKLLIGGWTASYDLQSKKSLSGHEIGQNSCVM